MPTWWGVRTSSPGATVASPPKLLRSRKSTPPSSGPSSRPWPRAHGWRPGNSGGSRVIIRGLCRKFCLGGRERGRYPCLWRGLGSQGVEQFSRSEAFVSLLDYQLPFLDHVHEFNADQGVLSVIFPLKWIQALFW